MRQAPGFKLGDLHCPFGGISDDEHCFRESELIAQLDSWSTEIQGEIDDLGKEDQLALISIQELNSQITQNTQLASNILAARDQAASTAIMNMKV